MTAICFSETSPRRKGGSLLENAGFDVQGYASGHSLLDVVQRVTNNSCGGDLITVRSSSVTSNRNSIFFSIIRKQFSKQSIAYQTGNKPVHEHPLALSSTWHTAEAHVYNLHVYNLITNSPPNVILQILIEAQSFNSHFVFLFVFHPTCTLLLTAAPTPTPIQCSKRAQGHDLLTSAVQGFFCSVPDPSPFQRNNTASKIRKNWHSNV